MCVVDIGFTPSHIPSLPSSGMNITVAKFVYSLSPGLVFTVTYFGSIFHVLAAQSVSTCKTESTAYLRGPDTIYVVIEPPVGSKFLAFEVL